MPSRLSKSLPFLLPASLLFFPILSLSQNDESSYTIRGRVIDERGAAIPFANIIIEDLAKGVSSDQDGNYILEKVPIGNHTITVTVLGFEKNVKNVTVETQSLKGVNFVLKEAAQNLGEVVVKGKSEASKLKESAQAVTVVQTEKVKLQAADLGEVMAKREGVSVQRAGGLGSDTRFALNGLSGDQIRFFYDGVPLDFSPYSFGIANVPVGAIDRAEVYKGVVPVRFGADALGGAVNLVPPEINERFGFSGSYQIGSFGTHRATAHLGHFNEKSGFFVSGGGFYDYTDNNYRIDAAIPDERGRLRQETVERFHDAYSAFGMNLKVGAKNKKWAKELSIKGYYGDYDNEIQNSQSPGLIDNPDLGIENAIAGNPFGEVRFTSFSTGLNLYYDVDLSKKWGLDLNAGYNYNERESIDIGNNLYNWFGEVVRVQPIPGEFGDPDNLVTFSESVFARTQISYRLSDNHSFTLSIAPTYATRTADDLLVDGPSDPALDDRFLTDLVSGLEHKLELFDERFQNLAFVKNYNQNIRVESFAASVGRILVDERSANFFGVGDGLRYTWSSRFSTKLSYEFAYRLPRQDEIFGDGLIIIENLGLRPESSHNINFQWTFNNRPYAISEWEIQGNLFLRQIDDLIYLLPADNDFFSYQNIWSSTSTGFELAGSWSNMIKGLTLSANTTYQEYRNTSDTGPFESFRGDRLPNIPYFFANGSASYQMQNIFSKEDNLSFFWDVRFVESFLLGWESVGRQDTKAEIPSQTVNNAGLTYQMEWKNVKNSLTIEMQNLANAKVFDFFGVQRPGRAVFVKLTTEL